MESFQNQINRVFSTSLTGRPGVSGWGTSFPSVDVYQDKDNVIVTAEVPGLDHKDIELSITGNTVTLKGNKASPVGEGHESEVKEEGNHRVERSYGLFQRVIELPCEVNADKAKAKLDNGVLTVTLPKSEAVLARKIEVA
jgi:HSP20 family protein